MEWLWLHGVRESNYSVTTEHDSCTAHSEGDKQSQWYSYTEREEETEDDDDVDQDADINTEFDIYQTDFEYSTYCIRKSGTYKTMEDIVLLQVYSSV